MEQATFVPETVFHVIDEVKEHEQMQVWTAEGYISDGSGDGPDRSEEEEKSDNEDSEDSDTATQGSEDEYIPPSDRRDLAVQIWECYKDQHIQEVRHVRAFLRRFGSIELEDSDFADDNDCPLPFKLEKLLQHRWFKQFAREHRREGEMLIAASSSSSSPPKPVSGRLCLAAITVARCHQFSQAEKTMEKHVAGLKLVAQKAIQNQQDDFERSAAFFEQRLARAPVYEAINQLRTDLRDENARTTVALESQMDQIAERAAVELRSYVDNEQDDMRAEFARELSTQQQQIDALKTQLKSMKAAMNKKGKPGKKVMKKVMKKATPKKKAMKKHSHV